jgi:hypothetical protein
MNNIFEKNLVETLIELQEKHGNCEAVGYGNLEELRDLKIGIDANLLLQIIGPKNSNPFKFIQEGGSSLDIGIQNAIVHFIQ